MCVFLFLLFHAGSRRVFFSNNKKNEKNTGEKIKILKGKKNVTMVGKKKVIKVAKITLINSDECIESNVSPNESSSVKKKSNSFFLFFLVSN